MILIRAAKIGQIAEL